MPDNVSISYQGATYALGQGPQFYGIWYATALHTQPLEWWPLTPEGWTAAWSRFASVEAPGAIKAVAPPPVAPMTGPAGPAVGYPTSPTAGQHASGETEPAPDPVRLARNGRVSAALIGIGLILGLIGLFPVYTGGASLASQPVDLVPHVIYLAAWALSGVLILLGGVRLQVGALLGLGTSAVTLGLFIADLATPGGHGGGLALGILSWICCSGGLALAAVSGIAVRRRLAAARDLAGRFGAQPSQTIVPLVTLILASLGAAIAFAPSWDSFTLRTTSGASQTVTAGNAFANPGAVIAGDVLTMIALVAVVVVAALWRPLRLGAALALGAAIPMVAQAISAIVQISQPTSPLEFGISSAEAARLGLTIDNGLTAMFWVFCAFLGTLILLCAWMLLAPGQPADSPATPGGRLPGGYLPGGYLPSGYAPGGYASGAHYPGGYQPGGQQPEEPAVGSPGDESASSVVGTSGAATSAGAVAGGDSGSSPGLS